MIEILGNFTLVAALLLAVAGVLSGVAAWAGGDDRWTRRARAALLLAVPMLTASGALLLVALARSDFRFAYVARHTESSLPTAYKLVALWAGQEGSLLLWAWMLAGLAAIAAISRRRLCGAAEAVTIATLCAANAFFAALLLFAANPFLLIPTGAPADGHGLNPMLQHWAMVLHPPTLFMGYAGFTIPFAILLGVLAAGPHACGDWAGQMRRWVIVSWLFLGAGIIIGAWWAYMELGWGGYWAWDPVENASLLPWLTGTALLHSLVIVQHRGTFRIWTASLVSITFVLCIFGTYLTRSGVIESVHAFGESPIGSFFLALICASLAISAAAIAWRWNQLRARQPIGSLVGREALFLLLNVLFLLMTGATLVGTIFPILSGPFTETPITVGQGFYNRIIAPLALAMAAVMALAPLLSYGPRAAESVRRGIVLPAAITLAAVLLAALLGLRNIAALACLAIALMAILIVAATFWHSLRRQLAAGDGAAFTTALRLLDANHRRYGGQLAHVGIVLLFIGVAGSSLFSQSRSFSLQRGEAVEVAGRIIRYDDLQESRGANYTAVVATVGLTAASGREITLYPQRRFYDKAENPSAEVALRSNLREDLYVILAGWEGGGDKVALQVLINPLTLWIWIGSAITLLAGVFCALPRLVPATATALAEPRHARRAVAQPQPAATPVAAH